MNSGGVTRAASLAAALVLLHTAARAQFVEDALRTIAADPQPSTLLARANKWGKPAQDQLPPPPYEESWIDFGQLSGFGCALALGPDLDGDCIPELLVAAVGTSRTFQLRGFGSWNSRGNVCIERGSVWALNPITGRMQRAWQGAGDSDRFGTRMCTLDDLDGDGIAEIAIASPGAREQRGQVECFSSQDGALLRVFVGEEAGAEFGAGLALLSDLDGDGLRDLAVGAPKAQGVQAQSGSVLLISVRSGAVLAHIPGPRAASAFGCVLDAEQDLNGDGVRDLVIGAPGYSASSALARVGLVMAVSAKEGRIMKLIEGEWSGQELGVAVGTLPSFAGGPLGDLVVVSGAHEADDPSHGLLQVYGAPDFGLILRGPEPQSCSDGDSRFGAGFAVLDDLDGDGGCEIAVGAPQRDECNDPWGVAFVHFSPGGECGRRRHYSIWEKESFGPSMFGASIVRLPDIDGDGVGDYAVGCSQDFLHLAGGVQIFSGKWGRTLLEVLGHQLPRSERD